MTQERLDFGRQSEVQWHADQTREVVRKIVAVVGRKEVAFLADVSPSYVTQALNGDKSLKIEIIAAARELAPDELRVALVHAIAGPGWVQRRELTPAEEAARLKAMVRREWGADGERRMREELER